MKLVADEVTIHNYIRMGTKPLFEIPLLKEITQDGKVRFSWTCGSDIKIIPSEQLEVVRLRLRVINENMFLEEVIAAINNPKY
ncbi:hypothetical protein [Flavihumibacter profundi]|uniref:hypothetical protein n=1 Tax=Flavihumibacter profundi TaxID=2716883 RepID=UPI001CC4A4C2|nr:hypothetical protein [Flavihumibacter profundi]MBZ5857593.1 hypothetical protein [Flavihumibacter profundi]